MEPITVYESGLSTGNSTKITLIIVLVVAGLIFLALKLRKND